MALWEFRAAEGIGEPGKPWLQLYLLLDSRLSQNVSVVPLFHIRLSNLVVLTTQLALSDVRARINESRQDAYEGKSGNEYSDGNPIHLECEIDSSDDAGDLPST